METFSRGENAYPFLPRTHDTSSDSEMENKIPNEVVLVGNAKQIAKNSAIQLDSKRKKSRSKNTKRVKRVSVHESPTVVYRYSNKPASLASLSSEDGIIPFDKAYIY